MRKCIICKWKKITDFCFKCFKITNNEYKIHIGTGNLEVLLIKLKCTHKRLGIKRFLSQSIGGWDKSINTKKHPKGVYVNRFISRENNKYKEEIVDRATGLVCESKEEPLTNHD